jgi:hypothetical protein
MTEIIFERASLYDEVWTTPLTRLCEKYGLSDNGLRKVCKALNIPLPNGGHWAKVAAGHKVPRIPLPSDADRTTFINRPGGEEHEFKVSEDEAWLAERIAFEEREENRITAVEKPTRWHNVVAPIRDELRKAVKEADVLKRDAERAKKNPRLRQEPNWSGSSWQWFADRGQILCHTHKSSPTRVSPLTCERTLVMLNTVCREAERRIWLVSFNGERGRIEFKGYGGTIEVRITERLDNKRRTERNEWDNKPRVVEYKEPTGKLRLYIGDSWSESDVSDDTEEKLEAKLNRVFMRMYRAIVRQRERKREQEARERAWQIEAAKREAAEARRREEEARKERERRRRRSLIVEAKQWKTATLIREYAAHVAESGVQGKLGKEAWTAWAFGVADALDPTEERAASLKTIDGIGAMIRRFQHIGD